MLPWVYWNITGLMGKFFGFTHSAAYFKNYIKQFKIISLVETWTKEGDDLSLEGYHSFSVSRPKTKERGRRSGGIIVFVQDSLAEVTKRVKSVSCNILWIWLELMALGLDYNVLLGTTYISPENSSIHSAEDTFSILEREILELKNKFFNTKVLIAGDFNGYTSTEADFLPQSDRVHDNFLFSDESMNLSARANKDPRNVNKHGRKLLDLCLGTGLGIVNGRTGQDAFTGEFTCYFGDNPSCIDYILSDPELFSAFSDFYVDCREESHHMPLCLTLFLCDSDEQETIQSTNAEYLPRFSWQEEKANIFLEKFNAKDISVIGDKLTANNVNEAVETIIMYISQSAEDMKTNRLAKKSKTVNRNEPWFDYECIVAKRVTIKALKQFRKCRCKTYLSVYKEKQQQLKNLYIYKMNIYQNYEKEKVLRTLENNDSKAFWSSVKYMTRKKGYSRSNIRNNAWFTHFHGLFNPVGDHTTGIRLMPDYFLFDESLDGEILDAEVNAAVTHLKLAKSPGEDGIPAEFYKAIFPTINHYFKDLFNRIYNLAYFPEVWSKSLIVPIHKKGSQNDPNNYRGISLLSIFSKIFMNIVYTRINRWCNVNGILCPEQGGFKKGYSTIDSIFTLNTIINKYTQRKGGRFYCAFIDFTKAFDLLNRDAIWFKLQKLKMSSKMIRMLRGIYQSVTARVITGDGLTGYFDCPWGVKQGCILSPNLFNLYINDLPAYFRDRGTYQIPLIEHEVSMLLYADDLVLLADSAIELQRQLNLLLEYCKTWDLKVNEGKSKTMVFRNGGKLRSYEKWFYNGKQLETCTYFTYLGVDFSSVLSWSHHIKTRSTKGLRALGCTQAMLYKIPNINHKVVWKVFDTKIKPIMHYGAEIWGYTEAVEIERVQNKLCKQILKINSKVPTISLHGELGRLPLKTNRLTLMINYWLRVVCMSDQRITKDAYKLQLRWAEQNKSCWLSDIREILCNHGFHDAWLNHGVGDKKWFMSIFKQRVSDMAQQRWSSKVNDMNRLQLYRLFKDNYTPAGYIDKLSAHKLSLVANFRCTGLPLKSITGVYYDKLDYDICFCDFCESPKVENEYHFLLECVAYNSIRQKLIPTYYWNPPSIHKYILLMNRTDLRWLNNFAMYIQEALTERQMRYDTHAVSTG